MDESRVEGSAPDGDGSTLHGAFGPRRLLALSVVSLAIPILIHAFGVGFDSLHILGVEETFNDQVIYVDAARHLIASGELTTGVIYPATLLQDYGRNFFYMPGHAVLVATSMMLVGDSAVGAMLPSLLGHLVCILCVYLIGRRLAGENAGRWAAVALAITPVFILYAFSAMAELTTMAVSLSAIATFVHLPRRLQPWAAPFLLVVPFLFRETSAFWIAPMVVLLLCGADAGRRERVKAAGMASVGSVLALGGIMCVPWIADRPSLFAQNLLGRTFYEKYTDAYFLSGFDLDVSRLVPALFNLAEANTTELFRLLVMPSYESLTIHALIWIPLISAALAWREARLRPLVLAWASFAVISILFTTLLYRWNTFIGVRQMMPQMTLGLVLLGAVLAERVDRRSTRGSFIAGLVAVVFSSVAVLHQAGMVTVQDARLERLRGILGSLPIVEEGVFVAHHELALIYVFDHPGRIVAFSPANRGTLELLDERADVTSALLERNDLARMTPMGLRSVGLRDGGSIGGVRFLTAANPTDPAP